MPNPFQAPTTGGILNRLGNIFKPPTFGEMATAGFNPFQMLFNRSLAEAGDAIADRAKPVLDEAVLRHGLQTPSLELAKTQQMADINAALSKP